jgi:hypothetical protein
MLSAFCAFMVSMVATGLAADGPKITFSDTTFDFEKIRAGEIVNHTFIFTNIGDQVLEIKDVRPSCGCTTAGAWEHEVQPGKSGGIPVRFNSTEYTGPVHKTIIIVCNDPSETNLILHLRGTIWRPIEVTPENATFLASSDGRTNEIRVVRILNNLEQPLTLAEPVCTNNAFQATLKTVRPGKEFELAISLIPQSKPVSLWAPVTLKTSSTNVPQLTVMVRALVQAPITAMPSAIILPGHPLTDRLEFSVTVRNNGADPLILSEPSVAAGLSPSADSGRPGGTDVGSATGPLKPVADTQARVQEVQPGRMFILAATFPSGFHVDPGQSVALRVKTNHPQIPVLNVPVLQGQGLKDTLSDSETKLTAQEK